MVNSIFSLEDLFTSFYHTSPVYVWIKDTENNLLNINAAAAALEGKSISELEGKSCYDIYSKEQADAFWKDDLEVVATGEPKLAYYEEHITPASGSKKWLQVNKIPIKSKDGKTNGVMVHAIDVTDIKEAEEQTRKREKMNRLLMDIAPFPIILSSLHENKFVYLNQTAAEVFNLSVEEALKLDPDSIYLDKQQRIDIQEKLLKDGNIKNQVVSFNSYSGEIIYGLISAIIIDYEGTTCSYNVFHDITQLKKNEIELSKIAEEFRLVFENSSDALFWADSDTGVIINCNRRGEELLGKPREKTIGLQHWEIHNPKEAEKYKRLFADIERTSPDGLELEIVNASGKVIPVNITVATINIHNHRITQASIQDISARIANEKALRESEKRYRTIVSNVPVVFFEIDRKGIFKLAEGNGLSGMGLISGHSVGESIYNIYKNYPEYLKQTEKALKGENLNVLVEINGNVFDTFYSPVRNPNGTVTSLIGVAVNISDKKKAERKLAEERNLLRTLINVIPGYIFVKDKESRFLATNLSMAEYLNVDSPEDVIGKTDFDFYPEEKAREFYNEEHEIFTKHKSIIDKEEIRYTKEGALCYFEITKVPFYDSGGSLIGLVGISKEITQRKNIEASLKESQEKLSTVIANAPLVLFQIDNDGIFRFSDGKGLERLGLKPGEVVGTSAFNVYKDFPEICAQINKALDGNEVRDIINVNNVIFEIQYNPVKNIWGKVTNIIGVAFDITERKLIEDALIESEERFRTLFMEMKEGVALHELVFDDFGKPVNYKILEVNPAFSNQTGIIADISKNKLATEQYETKEPPYLNEYASVAMSGESIRFESFFEPLERYFKISVVSPGKNRFATVFEDVTLQKKREKELRDKNAELERFTYTVSHDLKSPLVTIKGFIGMLEQDLLHNEKENIIDDIQRIKSATDKMTNLLNDLLELSRIGRIINPPVKVPMNSILSETIELLSGIIKQKNVEIVVTDTLPEVNVDRQRIKEVWQNLIENSIKFMGLQQNPKIIINYIQEDAKFIFHICDNGIGIDKKYQQTIFGLFNKLDNKSEGTGIGLALVKRIIEVHGGEVWVESEGIGKGTRISFSIPLKQNKKNKNI